LKGELEKRIKELCDLQLIHGDDAIPYRVSEEALMEIVDEARKEFPNPLDEKYQTYAYDFEQKKMFKKGINAASLHWDCYKWFEKWFGDEGDRASAGSE